MDFWKKRNLSKQHEPKQPLHHHLHHALNNFQTHFSNIIHQINPKLFHNDDPFCSLSSSSFLNNNNNNNQALSSAEIKKRMAGIRVYKVSNCFEDICSCNSDDGDRSIQMFYLSERAAHDFVHQGGLLGTKVGLQAQNLRILDTPLSEVVEFEASEPPIRLIPELSQVKSAIKETKKNMAGGDCFSGVPVFQSDRLQVGDVYGKKYRPAYLRKEDLEYARSAMLTPRDIKRDVIKVTALEDIVKDMKDSSTSKSNDILFVGNGMSWAWFHEQNRME